MYLLTCQDGGEKAGCLGKTERATDWTSGEMLIVSEDREDPGMDGEDNMQHAIDLAAGGQELQDRRMWLKDGMGNDDRDGGTIKGAVGGGTGCLTTFGCLQ